MFSWSGSACCGSSPGSGIWSRLFLSIEGPLPEVSVRTVQRPCGRPLDPLGRVLLRQPQDPEARLEALLRVRLRGYDRPEIPAS